MKTKRIVLLALSAMMVALASADASTDPLEAGFLNPPHLAQPLTWWYWVKGNCTHQGIVIDLKAMNEIGEGGVTIVNVGQIGVPPGSAAFMSPQWQGDVKFAVQEVSRLGLKMGIENCGGWSSSGGLWVKRQYAMRIVAFSVTHVQGLTHVDQVLKQPGTRLGYYRKSEGLAFPTRQTKQRIRDSDSKDASPDRPNG